MATVTTRSQSRLPILSGPLGGTSRPQPPTGTRRSKAADLAILPYAIAYIVLSRLWAVVCGGSRLRATFLTTALTAGTIGFLGVLAYEGVVHIPGTRTISSLATRLSNLVTRAEPDHVPMPTADAAATAKPLIVRQLAPTTGGSDPGPIDPGSDPPTGSAPQAPADPRTTPTVVPIPPPAVDLPPPPAAARLKSVTHIWQTWNNCGPATVTMALSAIGKAETQPAAVAFLKTSPEDKNVNPNELIDYVRSRGARSEWRTGGDAMTLKRLLAAGVPVIVEVGFEYEPGDWMGHYRLMVGYDDAAGRFIAYDSYQAPGQNVPQPYEAFDANWRAFNRTYMPVYLPTQASEVATIAGDADDPALLDRALSRAIADAQANPGIAFAWFNVGTSLVALKRMDEAAEAFDTARRLNLPWRMLWYQFGPFEAYLNTGRLNDVLVLANANIDKFNELEESHYYKGRALQAQGKVAEARAEYGLALKANARYVPARHYLNSLPTA